MAMEWELSQFLLMFIAASGLAWSGVQSFAILALAIENSEFYYSNYTAPPAVESVFVDPEVLYQDGVSAMNAGDGATAIALFEQAAALNYAVAIYELAAMYARGNVIEQDYSKALFWYQKAADLGYAAAQNNLGYMYEYGQGVTVDYAIAAQWYEKAIAQNYALAMYYLAWLHLDEKLENFDKNYAAQLLEKAGWLGDSYAQNDIGYLYEKGIGVEQNYEKAKVWYQRAALKNFAIAQYNLALLYKNNKLNTGVDFDKSFFWFQAASAKGDEKSHYQLGLAYKNGQGTAVDLAKACALFVKAGELTEALYERGFCAKQGIDQEANLSEAMRLWEQAAKAGSTAAAYELGMSYFEELEDNTQAGYWLREAAAARDKLAMRDLSYLLYQMLGDSWSEDDNTEEAEWVTWARLAAQEGVVESQYDLAWYYANGKGVSQNWQEAETWYKAAAEQNYASAQNNLALIYLNGYNAEPDYIAAYQWFAIAALQKQPQAIENLAKVEKHLTPEMWESAEAKVQAWLDNQ